jgi:hypothetical protein
MIELQDKLKAMSYELQVLSYELWATKYHIRAMSYDIWAMNLSDEWRDTMYKVAPTQAVDQIVWHLDRRIILRWNPHCLYSTLLAGAPRSAPQNYTTVYRQSLIAVGVISKLVVRSLSLAAFSEL